MDRHPITYAQTQNIQTFQILSIVPTFQDLHLFQDFEHLQFLQFLQLLEVKWLFQCIQLLQVLQLPQRVHQSQILGDYIFLAE